MFLVTRKTHPKNNPTGKMPKIEASRVSGKLNPFSQMGLEISPE